MQGHKKTLSHTEIMKLASIPSRELIYLVEKGVVIPEVDAQGRGSSRRYSEENLAEIRLAKHLRNRGTEVRTVAQILALVRGFIDELRRIGPKDWVPQSLADVPSDIWLNLVDNSIVFFRFRDRFSPYTQLSVGRRSSLKQGTEDLLNRCTDRLEINLAAVVKA